MMKSRLWVFRDIDLTHRANLAQGLSISTVTASLLVARGVTTLAQASSWMSHCLSHDPFLIPDMGRAIERLHQAVRSYESICFYGDYDVDGMSATSLYLSFFRSLGAQVRAYVPHRQREGYGLNVHAIEQLHAGGVTLLVTSDCGTTSHREIARAASLGMDVIVTDHHQTEDMMPSAVAIMNPHRSDAQYPFKGLCSAGLAYKVAQAYVMRYGEAGIPLESLLDLVALATIADVVPLHDENRGYVRDGLAQLSRGARCGIRALKQVAGVVRDCTAETIAFKLAPRLNAAGRLDHAMLGIQLLTTESAAEAQELAERLERLNRERQKIEAGMMAEAVELATQQEAPSALVLASRRWHVGVVGIIAARLVDRFHCPAIAIAIDETGVGKGSARTTGNFDLYQGLAACRDLLDAFGGHPSAAGVTIQEFRLDQFRARFEDVARTWAINGRSVPTLHIDAELRLSDVTTKLIKEIGALHPFGAGNPEPTFAVKRLEVMDARTVGDKHLKLTVRQQGSVPFDTIGFGMKSLMDRGIASRVPVDLAFIPELNHWNGYDRIQLRLRDLRPSADESHYDA
ncbi:Single-stranded-DNA-specific exonuclease RecJ [Nitrospira sp. KM1]|uniref:single-stranded-DNA-specific exonuclease RecJ n=1 Tax=Nitrospira sp. KM1 TaxID=1936990 RepID=UPI0013A7688E|nr:single-stranded-DNA-specific exonuclease RecJ [Nitrospira sp. KM1]BCA54324.1 Single-stranded-DNA-specific exonuclease RecJ [Nitrospira sp. KM1]